MDKTEGIIKYAHEKSISRQKEVLEGIEKMRAAGLTINFNTVSKATGASKSYLYGNKSIKTSIEKCRSNKTPRTQESKDVLIKALKKRVNDLERELNEYKSKDYKSMYNNLKKEYAELEKQLERLYDY